MKYETWERLADEVEVATGEAACWTCLIESD